MARMLGKCRRTLKCRFGCCDEQGGLGHKLVKINRAAEKRDWRRAV